MAKALGATVRSGNALEIGITSIRLTNDGKDDPVFGSCPETFNVFEWHGEVFDLPKDCAPLAGSAIAHSKPSVTALAPRTPVPSGKEENGIDALCRECAPDLIEARLTAQQSKQ